jgi:sugar phosphate isomerase/epimerase
MVMKLGVGTYAYAWAIGVPGYRPTQPMDALAFVRRSAELGAKLAQIADNIPLHELSDAETEALRREIDRLGLSVEVGTRGIKPDHARQYLDIARRFGSPILRVVVDSSGHHPDPPEVIAIIRGVIAEFEAADITLAIENHDRFKTRALLDILNQVGSQHVGICLDTVNSFGSLQGPEVVVAELGAHVVNLHIKDFSIERVDHNMGFVLEGAPAGQGRLDVPWLLQRLRDDFGRDFNAILELWPAPEADIDATVAKEDAWAVESMTYLRTLIKD